MSFRTRRVLISVPFYIVFQFFLLKYIFLLMGGIEEIYIVALALIIGLNRFVPMIFESRKSRGLTRFLTAADGVWMWASLLFLIDVVIIYAIGSFVDLPLIVRIAFLAIVPVLGIYNYWKAHQLVVHEKTIELPNLKRDISIAHLSDIHFGSVRHKQIIRDVSDKLNSLDCELAIISGDLADGSSVIEPDDFMAFSDVRMPIIFTPGNHDFYMGIENVIEACRRAGVIVLDNQSMEFDCLNIYGLTFSFDDRGNPDLDESIIKPDTVNILNYHVPYFWEEFSSLGFDVQLSGHTHGGQFYPAIWLTNLMFKYNMGLFKDSLGRYLHVTTGVGSMDTPMRWGTDSEIVVLRLKKV
jgi:hypothetical protein